MYVKIRVALGVCLLRWEFACCVGGLLEYIYITLFATFNSTLTISLYYSTYYVSINSVCICFVCYRDNQYISDLYHLPCTHCWNLLPHGLFPLKGMLLCLHVVVCNKHVLILSRYMYYRFLLVPLL